MRSGLSRKSNRTIVAAATLALLASVPAALAAGSEPAQNAGPGPNNEIVLGESIGGVSLGDTPEQIIGKIGEPTIMGKDRDGRQNEAIYGAEVYGVSVVKLAAPFYPKLEGNPSYALFTANPEASTPEGIHVNSTLEELKKAYGDKLKMTTNASGVEIYSLLQKSDAPIGDRTTDFYVLHGEVRGIAINSVPYFHQAVK